MKEYALSQVRLLMGNNSNPVVENEKEAEDSKNPATALPEMMVMMLDHIGRTYGSVEMYPEQESLKRRLFTP